MSFDRGPLISLLEAHRPLDPDEQAMTHQTLEFVRKHELWYQRENLSGHVTASAWIVDTKTDSVLLVHHGRLNRWFQPGGHIEAADDSPIAAALREAREETGLGNVVAASASIFDVDVHRIPATPKTPEHLHYDIRFLLTASSEETIAVSDESHEVRWVELEKLSEFSTEASLKRMAEKTSHFKTVSR